MLKKVFLLVMAFLVIQACSQEKIIVHDEFRPSLERSFWMNIEHPKENWKLEKTIQFSQERLRFRFISGAENLKVLELFNTTTGQVAWSNNNFTKPVMTPIIPPGEYIVRCSGVAGAEKVNIAVTSYRGLLLMPSWKTTHATVQFPESGGMLIMPSEEQKHASFSARIFNLVPGKFYRAEVVLTSSEPIELFMRYIQRSNGRKHGDAVFKTAIGQEQCWKIDFPGIAASADLAFQVPGKCLFKSIIIREIEPPSKTKNINGKVMVFVPRNTEADPPNPRLSEPVPYQRNPRMSYQDSIPQDFEIIDKLETFTTPGDYAVWHFSVHNPGMERELDLLEVGDLHSGNHVISADAITVSYVGFWDYPRNPYNYFNIPELILPQEKYCMPIGGNRLFWLQARLKADCMPGDYTGKAKVRCGEKVIELPLLLKVLPFQLLTPPDMVWSTYSRLHVPPQSRYSMELTVRYLEDMKNYGVTSLHCTITNEAGVKRFQEARRRAGMNGPMIVYGIAAERIAAKRRGADPKDPRWFDNPQIREAFVAYIKEFDSWIKKYGAPGYNDWYYMGADEPHVNRMEMAIWQTRLAREAGIPTASCVYAPRYVAEMSEYLNLSCNSFIANNAATLKELHKAAIGKKLDYWYLGGGCYRGQEGGLMPNRMMSGLMSFKLGVTGHLSYTYQSYGTDPYDNFTKGKSYGMTYPELKPSQNKISVFTLEWEGVREGITDYKYLYTLKTMIGKARGKGKIAEADAGQAVLDRIIGFVPWLDDYKPGNGITEDYTFDNAKADSLRMMAAEAIIRLKEIL